MKIWKIIVIIAAIPVLIYASVGNPFSFKLTYNALIDNIESNYNGKVFLDSYSFYPLDHKYVFTIKDVNGIESHFSYDAEENSFTDDYTEDSRIVLFMSERGKILNLLREKCVFPEEVLIDGVFEKCVIGENGKITNKKTFIYLNRMDKDDFAEKVMLIFNSAAGDDIGKIVIESPDFVFYSDKYIKGYNREEILLKIREKDK